MSDSVKEEEVESSGASCLSVIKEGIKVVSQGLSGLSVKTDGSKDPPPRFDTKGMKRSHDSEEEQDTDLSQDPLGKIVKLSTVSGPSDTEKYTVISSPEQYQKYKDDFNSEYREYRHLHAQLQLICRHLTKLQNEFEQMIHYQLLQEYLRIQKTYPKYNQERKRLKYLHNKLGHIKKSIAMFKQSCPGQVSSLSSHPGNVNKAPPDRPEQHPSTSESNLPVSEDIREESKEDEEDQPCPDDPERSNQQHQLLCGEAQNTNDKQHFQSELLTESGKTSYRKKTVISSPKYYQRNKIKAQHLEAQIEVYRRHLTKLQNDLKQIKRSKEKKKTYPNYTQERKRLENPHIEQGCLKKSIVKPKQFGRIRVSSLSRHPGNINKAPPDRPERHPSTSESNLAVSEDIREESKEDGQDQPCPGDPERSNQQHQLLCGEAQSPNDKQHFRPELLTESGKTSYRPPFFAVHRLLPEENLQDLWKNTVISSPQYYQREKIQSQHLEMYSGHLTKLLDDLEQQVKQIEKKKKDKQHFLPELLTESGKTSYRKKTVISSPEYYQRNKIKAQHLEAQIEVYRRHLTKLQNDLKQIKRSKEKKKTYPNYTQERKRLENPHVEQGCLKKSIVKPKQFGRIQVSSLSRHPGNINKAPPDRPEQHPSTSESDLPVSEDIREESKEDGQDQPCPDDPERSNQQHQLLCGEAQNTNDKQHFRPELLTESGKTSYRFRCPGSGVFQCESTGLVFVMVQEAELLYRTVQWDESLLRSAGKMAAGLLFDIKCSEDAAVYQLHLPHCEVMDAPLPEGLLSVVHITDDGMNFIEPLEITDTHVVVTVSHLSAFGIVRKFIKRLLSSNDMRPVSGQVLLFLGQPNPKTKRQKLNVFLLPRNIHLDEVSAQQRYSENIQVPSKCELIEDQSYTLHCPQAIKIQPKNAKFNMEFGPNYFPTFEVRLKITTEEVTLTVKDHGQLVVWEHDVDLTDSTRRTGQMNVPAEDDVPAEQKLSSVRSQFVERVSEPVLNQLLDKLLDLDFVNDEEMQSVKTQLTTQDKARKLIDTVRKKGIVASSVLIAALHKTDPNLSRQLMLS